MNIINILKSWNYDVSPKSFFVFQDESQTQTFGGIEKEGLWWTYSGKFQAEYPVLSLESRVEEYDKGKICKELIFTIISNSCVDNLSQSETKDRLSYFLIDFLLNLSKLDSNGLTPIEDGYDESKMIYPFEDKFTLSIEESVDKIGISSSIKMCFCYIESDRTEPTHRCDIC
jgi:hypothetical protein